MRHKVTGYKLGRNTSHRKAMYRNLVASLFNHKRVRTTAEKAKAVQPMAEKLITMAKKGTLAARRNAASLLGDRHVAKLEPGSNTPVKNKAIAILFNELAGKFANRNGGYTRIVKLAKNRLGDNAETVFLELVIDEAQEEKLSAEKAKPADAKAESQETEVQKPAPKKKAKPASTEDSAEKKSQEEKE